MGQLIRNGINYSGAAEVIDNLNSTRTDACLSANMGHTLANDIGTIETGSTAAYAHAKDEFFIWIGQFVKVTAAIAVGDTIALGTNVSATSVSAVLSTLNSNSGASIDDPYTHRFIVGTWTATTKTFEIYYGGIGFVTLDVEVFSGGIYNTSMYHYRALYNPNTNYNSAQIYYFKGATDMGGNKIDMYHWSTVEKYYVRITGGHYLDIKIRLADTSGLYLKSTYENRITMNDGSTIPGGWAPVYSM